MENRNIGQTGLSVTDVSFGCSALGNLYTAITDDEATAVLEHVWNAGVRYFDTAPHYGRGRSEQRLGRFLATRNRADFVVSSKVGRVLSPGHAMERADGFIDPLPNNVEYDYSASGIATSFEQSCERLRTNVIDIIYVHDIGEMTHGDGNRGHLNDLLEGGFDELQRLKDTGRIMAFGLGVNENQICLDILDHIALDVILLAGRLTLLERTAEEVLTERCRSVGTSLVLGGIFNSGILATGPIAGATYNYEPASAEILARVSSLQTAANENGMQLAAAALHFARTYPGVASVLISTGKISSVERNLTALDEDVDPEAVRRISEMV